MLGPAPHGVFVFILPILHFPYFTSRSENTCHCTLAGDEGPPSWCSCYTPGSPTLDEPLMSQLRMVGNGTSTSGSQKKRKEHGVSEATVRKLGGRFRRA